MILAGHAYRQVIAQCTDSLTIIEAEINKAIAAKQFGCHVHLKLDKSEARAVKAEMERFGYDVLLQRECDTDPRRSEDDNGYIIKLLWTNPKHL